MGTLTEAISDIFEHFWDISLDIPLITVRWTTQHPYFIETTHRGRRPTQRLVQLHGQLVAIIGDQRLVIGRTNGAVATSDTHVFLSVRGTVFSEAEVEVHVRLPFQALQPTDNFRLQIRRFFRQSLTSDQPYPYTPGAHLDPPLLISISLSTSQETARTMTR